MIHQTGGRLAGDLQPCRRRDGARLMIRDATIVMILGMGTVFLVLLALLGLMTLGGRLAARLCPTRTTRQTTCPRA
jgi:Na+-transporting methylmalonyl-CoA/oxaloacetate decarboxylase gamma subunit